MQLTSYLALTILSFTAAISAQRYSGSEDLYLRAYEPALARRFKLPHVNLGMHGHHPSGDSHPSGPSNTSPPPAAGAPKSNPPAGGKTKPKTPTAGSSSSSGGPKSHGLIGTALHKAAHALLQKLRGGSGLKLPAHLAQKLIGVACDVNELAPLVEDVVPVLQDISMGVTIGCTANHVIGEFTGGGKRRRYAVPEAEADAEADAEAWLDDEELMVLAARYLDDEFVW